MTEKQVRAQILELKKSVFNMKKSKLTPQNFKTFSKNTYNNIKMLNDLLGEKRESIVQEDLTMPAKPSTNFKPEQFIEPAETKEIGSLSEVKEESIPEVIKQKPLVINGLELTPAQKAEVDLNSVNKDGSLNFEYILGVKDYTETSKKKVPISNFKYIGINKGSYDVIIEGVVGNEIEHYAQKTCSFIGVGDQQLFLAPIFMIKDREIKYLQKKDVRYEKA